MAVQCLSCYQLVSFIDMPKVRLDLAVQVHGKRLSAMYCIVRIFGARQSRKMRGCGLHEG